MCLAPFLILALFGVFSCLVPFFLYPICFSLWCYFMFLIILRFFFSASYFVFQLLSSRINLLLPVHSNLILLVVFFWRRIHYRRLNLFFIFCLDWWVWRTMFRLFFFPVFSPPDACGFTFPGLLAGTGFTYRYSHTQHIMSSHTRPRPGTSLKFSMGTSCTRRSLLVCSYTLAILSLIPIPANQYAAPFKPAAEI